MKIQNAEKISKLLLKIKELDEEVVRLEKMANVIANDNLGIKVKFKVLLPQEEKEKDIIDKDESLNMRDTGSMFSYLFPSLAIKDAKKERNEEHRSFRVTDSEALQMLGVIIGSIDSERRKLIKKLESLQLS